MVTAHLCLGHFRPIWGSEFFVKVNIYNSTPPKNTNISTNLFHHYKVSSLALLETKNYCYKFYPCAILERALEYVFRTCKINIFTIIFFALKISFFQGSHNIFLSVLIRAKSGILFLVRKTWASVS